MRNEIGNTYGELTVVESIESKITPNGRKIPMVKAVCSCGKEKNVSIWDLRSGKTKTCNINHPHYTDRSLPAFNQLYRHTYRNRAINKGLEFSLTEDQFRILTQQECYYCGAIPTNNLARIRSGNTISEYTYNGIDRIDNTRGYTIDNVVTACAQCNHAKHIMTHDDFIALAKRIADRH